MTQFIPIGDRNTVKKRLPDGIQLSEIRFGITKDVLLSGGAISGSGTGVSLYVQAPDPNLGITTLVSN